LALRGHNESTASLNKGNFKEILNYCSKKDKKLEKFLKRDKTANYTSPEIQNELIGLLAEEVRSKITLSVIDCSVYGIMVDGTVDVSSIDQFSFCVRYVTASYRINEKFLGFWDSPVSTGEALYANLR